MSYIKPTNREAARINPTTVSELNYAITMLCVDYLHQFTTTTQTLSECIAALEMAKLELYRRVAAAHETKKMIDHGDVYA